MSTDYRPMKSIPFNELFDGRLEPYGISEHSSTSDDKDQWRGLTDGRNFLEIYANDYGIVADMTRRGLGNAPGRILAAIAEVFDTDIFSEHQAQFWGFDTEEEWDLYMKNLAEEDSFNFYTDIVNYLNGEKHDIKSGTIGMIKANIAKILVTDDRQLLDRKNREKMMGMVDAIYEKEHAVIITLTDEDLALAKLATTHEEDLPQA